MDNDQIDLLHLWRRRCQQVEWRASIQRLATSEPRRSFALEKKPTIKPQEEKMKQQINWSLSGRTRIIKRIAAAVVVVLILMIAAPVASIHAADLSVYCATPLNGTWNGSVCTIPAGSSGEVPTGYVIGILTNQVIHVNGSLTVNGTINLQGGYLYIGTETGGGTITNNGSINNYTIGAYGIGNNGTFANNGNITLASNTTFSNLGAFSNGDSGGASLLIRGTFENLITTFLFGTFTNQSSGVVNIKDSGKFEADRTSTNINNGTIEIDPNTTDFSMWLLGPLTNNGTITNKGGKVKAPKLTNSSTGVLYNDNYSTWICDESFSYIINEGTFTNRYLLYLKEGCNFTNKGSFVNYGNTYLGDPTVIDYGVLLNQGEVLNYGKIFLPDQHVVIGVQLLNENGGVITNADAYSVIELGENTHLYNTGLIELKKGEIRAGTAGSGSLVNNRWEYPWEDDPGVINKYCAGSINANVTRYFGPAPVNLCSGTIIIRKDTVPNDATDFSFSGGLGTFLLDDDADGTLPNERTFSGLTPGSYNVTEAAAAGFTLTGIACTSTETGDTTTYNLSTRTATIDLDGDIGETVTCIFTNTASCTTPAVTDQPDPLTVTYGQNASFTVAGTNYTNIQWQVNTGSGWTNISGANAATYTLTKPAVSLSGSQYRAVLSGSCAPAATSAAATLTVNKAPSSVAVTCPASVVYNGSTQTPCTAEATGAGMTPLDVSASIVYTSNTNAGTASANAAWSGDANHTGSTGSGSFEITKAPSSVVVTCTASVVYNGSAQTPCTAEATGAGMASLDVSASIAYTSNTNAGTASANAAWSGDANHTGSTGSGSFEINRANPACSVSGYTGIYSGSPHGAAGSCTGVMGEALSGLDLGAAFTDVPGGTASWSFTDATGNYNPDSGSVAIILSMADPVCDVSGYTDVYDGGTHGAAGSCTGVMGETLSGLDLGAAFTDVPGGTAFWTFTDTTGNYNGAGGSVDISISKADPVCDVSGYTGVYDGGTHGAAGSCTGVMGETLSGLDLGAAFTDVPGGTAFWLFTDATGNYNDIGGNAKILIQKATLTVTADNQMAQYSDAAPPLTFQYAGFQADDDASDLDAEPSCSTVRLVSDPAGTYTITCSGGDDNNYTFSYIDGTFTVTKESAFVTFHIDNPAALQVSVPGGALDAGELTLVVKVTEKLPDLPADKAAAGEIGNADLTVRLEPLSGGGAIELDCTAVVEGSGYDGVKTFTCTNDEALGVDTYDVVATVTGDYYAGIAYDGFTVYDPSLGFATGGGWFYWPGTTEKTTFGFTMKYNKKGTNVQGNLVVIRHHADGTISRLKSNALDGLALKDMNGCGIATFSGKATYMTWDPAANGGLGDYVNTGGILFSVYATDCNDPGTGVDSFWIRSVDKLMMSKPAASNAVPIKGGNIAIPHRPQ